LPLAAGITPIAQRVMAAIFRVDGIPLAGAVV